MASYVPAPGRTVAEDLVPYQIQPARARQVSICPVQDVLEADD